MNSPVTAARGRPNLVQRPLRTVQVLSYATSFAFVLVVVFADPGHRIALAALDAASALIHLILK